MPPSGATAEEIDDLENVIATSTSITKKEDNEHMTNVTVAGVQLEKLNTCVTAKLNLLHLKLVRHVQIATQCK